MEPLGVHLYSITVPAVITFVWLFLKKPDIFWWWLTSTAVGILCSFWVITPEKIELHGVNPFIIYLGLAVYTGSKIDMVSIYVLTFLSVLIPDIYHTISQGLPYYGIGGAGIADGLSIAPWSAVLMAKYIEMRMKKGP